MTERSGPGWSARAAPEPSRSFGTRVGFRASIENDQAARGGYRERGQFGAEGSYRLPRNGGQDRDDENRPERAERVCGAIAEFLGGRDEVDPDRDGDEQQPDQ